MLSESLASEEYAGHKDMSEGAAITIQCSEGIARLTESGFKLARSSRTEGTEFAQTGAGSPANCIL